MNTAEARELGYEILPGNYHGTNSDCAGRWYIWDTTSNLIDKRGRGFRTRREALEHLARITESE